MRIAVVGHSQNRGGAEHVTRLWAEGLVARGHEVTLFGVEGRGAAEEAAAFGSSPAEAWAPDGVRAFALAPASAGHLAKARRLRRELQGNRYDVCLAMATYPALLTLTATLGLRSDTRVLVSERNVPSVLLKHQGRARRLQLTLARRMYRLADAAIAVAHPVAGDLVSSFHLDPGRVYVVPNPSMGKAPAHAPGPRPPSEYEISVVLPSRLVEQKRPLLAAAVAEELARRGRKVEILSFGTGPLRAEFERETARMGVPVRLNGWVDWWMTDLPASAVVLLTSRCEGQPNVLVEAAAAGIPSVGVSSALGVADALVPGMTGELAISDDPSDIADAVEKAATLWVDAGAWLERFSVDNSVEHLLAVFEHVRRRR
jgi:glycosyltransferase involved in cell wall biosynthesis